MGYDSRFCGSMTPSKPIPQWMIDRIRDADLCIKVQDPDESEGQGETGDIIPVSYDMHGYNMAEELLSVQRLLLKEGIILSGTIDRSGLDGDDWERFEAIGGSIYVRGGEVVYGRKNKVKLDSVCGYAIRVSETEAVEGVKKRKVTKGWLCSLIGEYIDKKASVVVPPSEDGSLPRSASVFTCREDAVAVMNNSRKPGFSYDVIKMEKTL